MILFKNKIGEQPYYPKGLAPGASDGHASNKMALNKEKSRLIGLGTALETLTLIPWPWKRGNDFPAAIPWFPVIGFFLGLVLYGAGLAWGLSPFTAWPAGGALVMVGAEIFFTRGLHLDGLADWADSIGGGEQKEKRLAIMKDVSLGTFGVLALFVSLSAKWIALERLMSSGSIIWVPAIFVLSRDMMAELVTTLPYARRETGMARVFVARASPAHRLASHGISLGLLLPFGPLGLAFFALGWIETRLFAIRCRHEFGGITGDLLGTANEMVAVSLLMICALPGESILCYTGWAWVF